MTSDALPCFGAIVETCPHWSIVTGGGAVGMQTQEFTRVDTMPGNAKDAIHGTYHSIHGKHLGRYLGEFACRTAPLPYRLGKMAEVHT